MDPRVYEILRNLNAYLAQVDAAFGNVARGTTPDGSGGPLGGPTANLDDYLYLPGRGGSESTPGVYNGQTVFGNVFFKPYTKLQANSGSVASWSSTGDFTATSSVVGGTTWSSIPIQTSASVGEILVLVLSTNPAAPASAHHSTLIDTQGNTWTKRGEASYNDISGQNVTNSIWTCYVATALTATIDTLTAGFSVSVDVASVTSHRFTVGGDLTISVAASTTSTEEGAIPPLPPTGLTLSGLTSQPYLFVRASGSRTWNGVDPPSYTASTNYTAFRRNGTGINNGGNKTISYAEYRAVTATGDTTDPTTGETYGIFSNIYVALMAGTAASPSTDISEHIVEVKSMRDNTDPDGFCIRDPANDARFFFDFGGEAAGTYTITYPLIGNGELLVALATQQVSNKTLTGPNTIQMSESADGTGTKLVDRTTPTKKLALDLSGITTATTRIWTVKDWAGVPVVPSSTGTSGYLMVSQGTNQPVWSTVAAAVPGSALTKTDDTNVTLTLGGTPTTALLQAASLTLGWTGTLAAARLNSAVVQGITNDTNVTGSITSQILTLGWTGQLAESRGGTGVTALFGAAHTWTGNQTFGVAGTDCLLTVGQGTTGTDGAFVRVRGGSSGGPDTGFYISTNVTDKCKWIFNNTSTYFDYAGDLNVRAGVDGTLRMSLTAAGLLTVAGSAVVGGSLSATSINLDVPAVTNFIALSNYAGVWQSYNIEGDGTNYITGGDVGYGWVGAANRLHFIRAAANQTQVAATFISNYAIFSLDLTSGRLGLGFGNTNPGATLDLTAGTATQAPLKFSTGINLTTPVAGVLEFVSDDFFATITTGAARKAFVLDDGTRLTSGRVPFATTNGRLTDASAMTFASSTLTVSNIAATTHTGNLTFGDAINVVFNATTGTKLGTATSQKLGIWNTAPIVQPTTAIAAATFVANTSLISNDSATFDGYTIGQVVKALRNIGLLA